MGQVYWGVPLCALAIWQGAQPLNCIQCVRMTDVSCHLQSPAQNPGLSGPRSGRRMAEVDALRGIAALAVVLFHFTTRFTELYPDRAPSAFSVPLGHYGVNLFFVISGFVIFMSLDKTVKPMDFVVSRFSRLFPAYWVAIGLTFTICHLLGLPGRLVDAGVALANVFMVHGLLRVPHVDGVYWTLEVELLFYAGMLCLYRLQWLNRVSVVLSGCLLLRLLDYALEQQGGIHLPWMLYRLLILQYLPWFSLGIAAYFVACRPEGRGGLEAAWIVTMATATLWICESAWRACWGVGIFLVVYLAATGWLVVLRWAPLVWLGVISYPLYLLHENIGWAIQLRLHSLHMPAEMAVIVALLFSLFLAHTMTAWVERPAMRWIRSRHFKASTV